MKTQSNIPFPTTPQRWNETQTVSYINQTSFTHVNEVAIAEQGISIRLIKN